MPTLSPVTKAVMLICTALFCLDALLSDSMSLHFALWPLGSGMFMPWQVVTYALLHGSLAHLFFNMLGLWIFGPDLERVWGARRYLQFLLASTLTAAAAQLLVTWLIGSPAPTIGISGALYGLLLGYALTFPRRQFDLVGFLPMLLIVIPGSIFSMLGIILYFMLLTNRQAVPIPPIPVPALVMVLVFGGLELFLGMFFRNSGIAHFAHLGGMLGGYLMIRYWRGAVPSRRR
jgi:membrane associated rhomboid family serine protease